MTNNIFNPQKAPIYIEREGHFCYWRGLFFAKLRLW